MSLFDLVIPAVIGVVVVILAIVLTRKFSK